MKKQMITGVLCFLISAVASAHPGHELASGMTSFSAGFMHPLTGWDHLLVMFAIGVWAAKLGGKARWQLPLAFVITMALGAILGLIGLSFAGVETAIAASVIAMGLLLGINLPISAKARIGITALFAVMHGMAHGIEFYSNPFSLNQGYVALAGMLLTTALLHGAGLIIGAQRYQWLLYLRASLASSMVLIGGYLLFAS